jgi:N-acetylneuraminic acid mutarotase
MNTGTQKLIVPAVLSLLLATTAPLAAGAKKTGGGGGSNTNTFSATGSMNVARYSHQTILLGNGQVLAVTGDRTTANTAELYNPATGTWTLTGTPAVFHEGGSVTRLANGEVLLAGGNNFSGTAFTAAAELYNPSTGKWGTTGSMTSARQHHSAVLLPNGEVLVAGGEDPNLNSIATAELYNPATGTWQSTASMHQSRYAPVAELLGDGTVLVAGGEDVSNGSFISGLASAEIYNPSTGNWASIADMPSVSGALGSPLPGGDVLVVRNAFFNPGTGTWTATGPFPNGTHIIGPSTATLLTTGDVLLTGSRSTYNDTPTENTTWLYNLSSNTYAGGALMTSTRYADAATLLPNGQVLVSGGYRKGVGIGTVPLSSAELYTP